MKKPVFLVLLLATFVLGACNSNAPKDDSKDTPDASSVVPSEPASQPASQPAPSSEDDSIPTIPSNGIALVEGQTVKFEAENATPTAWKNSGWGSNDTFVANDAEANASGGAFVTPSTGNVDANRKFEIVIYAPKDGTVNMQVAYCRGGKNSKTATIDYSYVYQYRLDGEEGKLTCTTADPTDSSVASWDWKLIDFTFTVTKGLHTLAAYLDSANANTNAGCPCVDYYNFTI